MADTRDSFELEAVFTGDLKNLKRAITQAKKMIKSLNGDDSEVEIEGDNKDLQSKVQQSKLSLKEIAAQKYGAKITAENKEALSKIKQVKLASKSLSTERPAIQIIARNAQAIAQIKRVKLSAKDLSSVDPMIDIDVLDSAANARIVKFKAMLRSIPNRVRTRLIVSNKSALNGIRQVHNQFGILNNSFDELANDIRTFGTIFGNVIKGAMIGNITALVPIIASIVPAFFAVLNAVGVLAGGIAGIAGALAVAGAGAVAFGGMAVSAIKMVNDGTLAVTKEVNKYRDALTGVKTEWQNLIKANQSEIFMTMANALNAVRTSLQQLSPFINGVATGFQTASQKLLNWANNSQVAKTFFNLMGSTGVTVFNNMMSAAGKFGNGFIALLNQLFPLIEWVSQGFINAGNSFMKWATSVEGSQAIQNFIKYVQTNLPLIWTIFSQTFQGIFNLMKAFAPNSQSIFQSLSEMATRFADWSARIAESDGFQRFIDYVKQNGATVISLIGNVIMTIVNLGIAMAPLGQAVLSVANKFFGFMSRLLETNPIVGQIIGVLTILGGIFMQLAPLILTVGQFIVPLATKFGLLTKVGTALKTGLGLLATAFGAISAPVWIVIGVIAALAAGITYLWNTNETFRTTVINIWNSIKTGIMNAVNYLMTAIPRVFTQIVVRGLSIFRNLLSGIISVFSSIKSFISTSIATIRSVFSAGFQFLLSIARSILSSIASTVSSTFSRVVSLISNGISRATSFFSNGFNRMRSLAMSVLSNIASTVSSAFSRIVSFISNGISRATSFFSNGFNRMMSIGSSILSRIASIVSSTFSRITSAISNGISRAVSAVSSGFSRMLSVGRQMISSLASAIRGGMQNVLSAIRGGMNSAVSVVTGAAGRFLSAGRNIVSSIAQGIRGAVGKVTSAIGSVTSKIREFLPFSPAKRGALRDIMKTNVGGSVAETIRRQKNLPVNQMKKMTKNMQQQLDAYDPKLNKMPHDLLNDINGISSSVNHRVASDVSGKVDVEPRSTTLQADLHLGDRDYRTFVEGVTDKQNKKTRLKEIYS